MQYDYVVVMSQVVYKNMISSDKLICIISVHSAYAFLSLLNGCSFVYVPYLDALVAIRMFPFC